MNRNKWECPDCGVALKNKGSHNCKKEQDSEPMFQDSLEKAFGDHDCPSCGNRRFKAVRRMITYLCLKCDTRHKWDGLNYTQE